MERPQLRGRGRGRWWWSASSEWHRTRTHANAHAVNKKRKGRIRGRSRMGERKEKLKKRERKKFEMFSSCNRERRAQYKDCESAYELNAASKLEMRNKLRYGWRWKKERNDNDNDKRLKRDPPVRSQRLVLRTGTTPKAKKERDTSRALKV